MRIGINTLAAHPRKTGIATYITNLVQALLKVDPSNHDTLFVSRENAMMFPDDGPRCRKKFGPAITENTNIRVLWEHTLLPWTIRENNLDLFHGPTFVAPFLSRIPNVVTIADMTWFTHPEAHQALKRWYYQRLIPVSIRRARCVIAMSESTRRDIVRLVGAPKEKVVTVHCGVEASFRPNGGLVAGADIRRTWAIAGRFILFLGVIEPRKNIPRLLQAFAEVLRRGFDGRLVMVGPKGWGYVAVARTIGELGLERHDTFTGPLSDEEVRAFLREATLFAYPSLYEGFGLPVLEAMACGAPVVTSNVSSLPEVVGDAGIMIDPLDVNALTDALDCVLSDSALRERLRQKGLEQAREFTWEATARRTLAIYEDAHREEDGRPGRR
jgi:glycosyltransferase involved in cell wall biosynthesis